MNEIAKYDLSESLTLQKVSEGLFASGLFPNAKNKFQAFAILQYGRELGIPPMMSLKNINLISGQLACNAQLMLTLALQKGVTYEVLEEGEKGAKIRFRRNVTTYEASFTERDAQAAGLVGKDNWRKYPLDMYFWRAVAKGVRRIAPDAVMGLYTAEEITEGAVIEVSEIPPEPVQESPKAPPVVDMPEDAPVETDTGNSCVCRVTDFRRKSGKSKAGKEYIVFSIVTTKGDFSTFSASHATVAKEAKESGCWARIHYEKTKFGSDLKGIALLGATDVADYPAEEPPF